MFGGAAAAIGLPLNIAGGFMGMRAANRRADAENYANQLNYNQSEKERLQGLWNAMRLEGESKLGSTDAQGNRTRFEPGTGWVVDLSDATQRNVDAGQFEQFQQLTHDASRNRANADRISENANDADRSLQSFQQQLKNASGTRIDPERRRLQNVSREVVGYNQGFDEAQESFMQNLRRVGSNNAGDIAGRFASERGEGLAQIMSQTGDNARIATQAEYDDDRSRASNLMQLFQQMSLAAPTGGTNTVGADGGANAGLGLASNRQAQNNAITANAFGRTGGRADTPSVSNGLANFLATTGGSIESSGHALDQSIESGMNSMSSFMEFMKMFNGG